MKHLLSHTRRLLAALLLGGLAASASAATTDISSAPLLVASPSSVKANLLFILDDSGSMDFDFMPDHVNTQLCRSAGATSTSSGSFGSRCCLGGSASAACWQGAAPFGSDRGHPPFLSSSFNGMAYNPAIRYLPPVKADGSEYPSMTAANSGDWKAVKNDAYSVQNTGSINLLTQFPDTEWCTDTSYTDCLRNGNYVLPGSVDSKNYTTFRDTTASGTGLMAVGAPEAPKVETRAWGPHYYNIIAGEFCDNINLRNCQDTASGAFTIPAPVRWCNSDANARAGTPATASCQATRTDVYQHPRFPTKYFSSGATASTPYKPPVAASAQFTINSFSCSTTFTAVTVNGRNLLSSNTSTTNNRDTLGASIAARINSGNSQYTATTSNDGRTVKITAPVSAGNINYTVSFSRTPNNCSVSTNPSTPTFSGYVAEVPATAGDPARWKGSWERVDIVPARTSYPKAAGRTDCAAANCSYAEEMTNFANWWTYYHTRMQSMKSSASRAFAGVGDNRRVGYLSINNSTGSDFLNLDTFEDTATYKHKTNWFSKLTKAKPNSSTPLRTALTRAGRLYGGKLNGSSLNGSTVKDPMLYSCQKNFTILSTDGFWNETSTPTRLDGSTAIGDQDSGLARPMYDGTATSNSLADTAAYYFKTDLRTGKTGDAECTSGSSGEDVCGNSKDKTVKDDETQNMRTFTLGLGASGYMQFQQNYLSATSGDFWAVKEGATPNTAGGVCTWQTSGACNWPTPVSNTLTTIDDLWHAAVNGGGTYFSASDPVTLETGLTAALNSIDVQTKAAAAATTSNPNVSAGDNQVFVSNFSSGVWSGELVSQRMNVADGKVDDTKNDWSARDLLDANGSRRILMFSSGAADKLKPFDWANLSAAEQAYFSKSHITAAGRALSQFCAFGTYCLSGEQQDAAAGEALVNFLRGDRSNEGDLSDPKRYFRLRANRLGDIVNSEAVYVKSAAFEYTDAGYAGFKTSVANRGGVVYVGANDGMLHAFSADSGQELWAYVPTAVLPRLYKLADKEYATKHEYFVDGTPTVRDVYIGGAWRTLLVGGLGAGGRSYFALDVTDPANPKALWEFSHDNLGLTLGSPEIGKLKDGSWAVFFGSGYNNVSPGDGRGRLFIVNAADGSLIRTIDTGAGDTGTPAGLAHLRGWVESGRLNNTIERIYAGDNLGNVWRFDVNDKVGAPGYDAQRLATLRAPDNSVQPITSRPVLGQVGKHAMVFVGTGRYLGMSDLGDNTKQSIYGIKDRLDDQDFGNPRLEINRFVKQTIEAGKCPADSAVCKADDNVRVNKDPQEVNLSLDGGWYVDLPEGRERVTTDPQLALGTLVVNSNVIETGNVCKVGGSSYGNYLDFRTGAPVSAAKGVTSVPLGDAIATRPALVRLPNGKVISISRLSNNDTVETDVPIDPKAGRRMVLSWRELLQD
jgi:type IV pilus assembly protein PilY1